MRSAGSLWTPAGQSRPPPLRSSGAFSPVGFIALRAIGVLVGAPARDLGIMGRVEILYWWLPAAIVTVIAMLWVSWLGRARDMGPDRSDAAQERFAAAIMRDLPTAVTSRVSEPRPMRDRSTGIAIRPSQRPGMTAPGTGGTRGPEDTSRRSA